MNGSCYPGNNAFMVSPFHFGNGDDNDDNNTYAMYTTSRMQCQEFHMHYLA